MNETILTSSILIVFLIILRRMLRGRIAPTLQYSLWLLVAARLLIPGALFHAPVTALGIAHELHSAVGEVLESKAEAPSSPEDSHNPIYIPDQNIIISPVPTPIPNTNNTATGATEPQNTPPTPSRPIDWQNVIWKSGILLVGIAFAASNLTFYLRLRRSRQPIAAKQLPIPCPLPVYCTDASHSPCLFGRAIYLTSAAMHPDRIQHVLTHELAHHRHADQFWSLVRCVCLAVHWYNPLVWWAAALSRRDCETSCDSAVLRRLSEDEGIRYGETLLSLLTSSRPGLLRTATTMSNGKRTITERLTLIIHRPRMMKLTLAAVLLVVMGVVIFTFGGCADETAPPDGKNAVTDTTTSTPGETTQPDTGNLSDSSGQPADGEQKHEDDALAPPDNGFGFIPTYDVYEHPSKLFTMNLLPFMEQTAITVETEDGVSFYDAEAYQSGSEHGWILSVQPQPADWTGNQNPTIPLASFDPNGTPQVYVLEYSTTYSEQFASLRELICDSFTLHATAELFSRLIHDNYEDNLALAISYLPYLNWRSYRELYDFPTGIEPLQTALWQFASSGKADWGQYHDMLSMTNDGLDGAYSQNLASIFSALFTSNQEQFLSVANSMYITDAERARIAQYVKYDLGTHPTEDDSQEITFSDNEVILGILRSYMPSILAEGSPADISITLTGDWSLEGIKAALFAAVSERTCETLLRGHLSRIEIGYSFHFPEEMRDGVTLTVPFSAIYLDNDNAYTLPSGQVYHRGGRTSELTATIQLVGEGKTAPVDDTFAKGQAMYDLLTQLAIVQEPITASLSLADFQLLDEIRKIIEANIADAGLSEVCRANSMSCGQHYNPLWCNVGYEQTVNYSVTLMYIEGERHFQYTFHNTVILKTIE